MQKQVFSTCMLTFSFIFFSFITLWKEHERSTITPLLHVSGEKLQEYKVGNFHLAYVSHDEGRNWTQTSILLPRVDIISSIIKTGNKVYVGTKTEGIYLSTDEKKTWKSINNGLPDLHVRAIAADDHQVLVATNSKGVFWSGNAGKSWQAVNGNLPGMIQVFSVAIYGKTWMIGTHDGIYTTQDEGKHWLKVHEGDGYTITIDAFHFLVSTMQGELLRFSLLGWPWEEIGQDKPVHFKDIYTLLSTGTTLLAGSQNHGIWISHDHGITWYISNTGIPVNESITGLYIDGANIYAFTNETLQD